MSSATTAGLRLSNQKIRQLLARLQSETGGSSAVTPQHFEELLEVLLSAAESLRRAPQNRDAELANEIAEYCRHTERLREILPTVQGRLLTERARLETERTHLAAAAAWAQSSKHTR